MRNPIDTSIAAALLMAGAAGFYSASVAADEPTPEGSFFDLTVVRPLGTAATLAGAGFTVGTAPITAPAGKTDETWDQLVEDPADYTFDRELGHYGHQ